MIYSVKVQSKPLSRRKSGVNLKKVFNFFTTSLVIKISATNKPSLYVRKENPRVERTS